MKRQTFCKQCYACQSAVPFAIRMEAIFTDEINAHKLGFEVLIYYSILSSTYYNWFVNYLQKCSLAVRHCRSSIACNCYVYIIRTALDVQAVLLLLLEFTFLLLLQDLFHLGFLQMPLVYARPEVGAQVGGQHKGLVAQLAP